MKTAARKRSTRKATKRTSHKVTGFTFRNSREAKLAAVALGSIIGAAMDSAALMVTSVAVAEEITRTMSPKDMKVLVNRMIEYANDLADAEGE